MINLKKLLKKYVGRKIRCGCGQTHYVPPIELYTGKNGLGRLVEILNRLCIGTKALVVADKNTFVAAGELVSERLAECGYSVSIEIYCPSKRSELTAEYTLTERLCKRMKGFDFAVAVGSGTINDLTKYASFKNNIPYIVYATAPSMNGYPSFMAALAYKGIKKSFPARPALAIIGDIDVLCSAPMEMITSGLGDGISKSVCNIDWKIAGLLKKEWFCMLPVKFMEGVMDFYLKQGPKIKNRDKKTIKNLFEALNAAGIAMTLAGSTKPASGGEHYVSHYMDMMNTIKGKKHPLHGHQVSIGTIISSKLYEYLMLLDIKKINMADLEKKWHGHKWTKKYFTDFYGKNMAGRVMEEAGRKNIPWDKKEKDIRSMIRNWPKIRNIIKEMLVPSKKIIGVLKKSGVPVAFSRIGVSEKDARDALLHCREIRSRYIVFDIAYDLGVLEEFVNSVKSL